MIRRPLDRVRWLPMPRAVVCGIVVAGVVTYGVARGYGALVAVLLFPILVLAAVFVSGWWSIDRPHAVRRHRRSQGLCVQCGYDLTGNVSGVCPECGREALGVRA
jgi:hypothetical protein